MGVRGCCSTSPRAPAPGEELAPVALSHPLRRPQLVTARRRLPRRNDSRTPPHHLRRGGEVSDTPDALEIGRPQRPWGRTTTARGGQVVRPRPAPGHGRRYLGGPAIAGAIPGGTAAPGIGRKGRWGTPTRPLLRGGGRRPAPDQGRARRGPGSSGGSHLKPDLAHPAGD